MATDTQNLPYDTSTVANYKLIFQRYGTDLNTFGWVQVMDTGTVSWAGVSTLPGNGVWRDWEIWRMADTAQGTCPVFMKLEYSTQGTNAPQLRITIGTGSNGTGTITGSLLENALVINGNRSSSLGAGNLYASFFSGATGRFMGLLWEGATGTDVNVPLSWGIERSKDSSGADTDEFVVFTALSYAPVSGTFARSHVMTKTGLVMAAENRVCAMTSSTGSNNFNGTTGACNQFMIPGKLSNPLMNYAVTGNGDAGEGATVTVNVYGASHTYIACKAAGRFDNICNLGGTTVASLCRYE